MTEDSADHLTQLYNDAGAFHSGLLGFGSLNKDKSETFSVGRRLPLSAEELWILYEHNNFIGNLIDAVPDGSTQKFCVYESDDPESIQNELDRAKPHINQAWKLARLQGWAAVLVLFDDGELNYEQPVNERGIRGISGYNALGGGQSGKISVSEYDENPFSLTYGEPLLFAIAGRPERVHVSRLLLFYGVKRLSKEQSTHSSNQLGTSVVDRCHTEFRNFDVSNSSIAATIPDFNIDVYRIPGLAALMAKQKDFADYIAGMAFARSVLKVMPVEAGMNGQNPGGYEIINRSYVGIKDLLEFFKNLFAGATDLNHTMLFGESPSGQTSGKHEQRSFAQYIANQQTSNLDPELKKLINYFHLINGSVPEHWELKYPSILELDEAEEADIELKQAQRLGLLVDKQVVTPEEAARSMSEGIDIAQAIDLEAREEERKSLELMPEGVAQLPSALQEGEIAK